MIDAKLDLVPRYRQMVRSVPFDLGRPVWVDDPHFNIEYHLRHTALPAPGGEDELRKLVGRVMAQQLDRSKPLWEIWVVEGLEDGRWAMLSKVHHAMVDGVSGTDLLAVIMDLSARRRAPAPAAWTPEPAPPGRSWPPRPCSTWSRSPYEQVRAVRAPTRVPAPGCSGYADRGVQGLVAMAGLVRPPPLSSLNGPARPAPPLRLGLDVGGGHQDGAQGPRRHLQRRRAGLHHRRVPRAAAGPRARTSTGWCAPWCRCRCAHATAGKAVGDGTFENKVSAMFAELPVDIEDPVVRLHAITAQMEGLKESKQAVAGEALTSMSGFAPPMLLAARHAAGHPGGASATSTPSPPTCPGPQFPLYVAGRRMLRAFPYVPLGGQMRHRRRHLLLRRRGQLRDDRGLRHRRRTSTSWPAGSRTAWRRC